MLVFTVAAGLGRLFPFLLSHETGFPLAVGVHSIGVLLATSPNFAPRQRPRRKARPAKAHTNLGPAGRI